VVALSGNNFSDDEIVDALTDRQMIEAIDALPFGINSQVAESGTTFSVGER
jgi:ABC-type multidrug transport system fused ATPase/permease subunit